jgi:hypothetical protein
MELAPFLTTGALRAHEFIISSLITLNIRTRSKYILEACSNRKYPLGKKVINTSIQLARKEAGCTAGC